MEKLNNWSEYVPRLFAQPCVLCGARMRWDGSVRAALCAACWSELPWLDEALCPRCALPTPGAEVCGACLKHPPRFDATHAALRYRFPIAALLHAFKYRSRLGLSRILARMMLERGVSLPSIDCMIPLPASAGRLRERGFNQAAELARLLSRHTGVPLATRALRKVRETQPQVELPWDERRANVRGAFACDRGVQGKAVALIDDVITTGATVDAASAVLKQAGARSVTVWVLARALRP